MEKHPTRPVYYFILIAVIILGGLYVWDTHFRKGAFEPVSQNIFNTQNSDTGLVNHLSFQNKKILQNNIYTSIDIEYPEFLLLDAQENRTVYDFYIDFITEHNTISRENMQARFETDEKNNGKDFSLFIPEAEEKYQAYATYTPVQINDTFISVLYLYGAFQGGAHGFENMFTLNYDVKNKKVLTLLDILKDTKIDESTPVHEYISEESRKQLLKKFAPEVEYKKTIDELVYDIDQHEFIIQSIYDGTEPTTENFSIYTFTPDALTIYFGQYQVASYADGIQEVVIPLK